MLSTNAQRLPREVETGSLCRYGRRLGFAIGKRVIKETGSGS